MPLQLVDMDVASELEGQRSVLIIPCYMCPAVTVSVRENKPFLQLLSHFLKSPPFERHIKNLQAVLKERGVESTVFKSRFVAHWFLCMWSSGRRRKLKRQLRKYDSALILGCDSATETVRELIDASDCKVIQGMDVAGFMNAKLKFHLPCNVSFEGCRIIPLSEQKSEEDLELNNLSQ